MPDIQSLYETYQKKGGVVLTLITGEEPQAVAAFMNKEGLSFPVLIDPKGDTFAAYRVSAHPAHYWIDSNGKISDLRIGYTDGQMLAEKLDAAFR